ncbi:casein kinase 2 regulatory subunit [Meristemomyces frigidus]|uniref:Casein kinase II subunit beta n=1 Tax=Meristemomyces frigidus TaxID=1508187 RepID=A0AAN7TGY7_9PEZI|nr:casein kinase 2 regulatory subunit [Meristemomyces frigidus]
MIGPPTKISNCDQPTIPATEGTLAPHAELAARIHDDELREAVIDPGGDANISTNNNHETSLTRNRTNSLSAAFAKACSLDDGVALSEMSSSSQAPESWISAFCSLVGHEYFAEVSEDFIEDDFNLTGLQSQVSMYKEALEMILDVEPEDASEEEDDEEDDDDEDEDDMQGGSQARGYRRTADAAERRHLRMASDLSVIESSAEMLYGLIHQRFITSRPGIQQMAEKYELGHFGHCPRVLCSGAKVLPVGLSDIPGQETVKLFCPSCLDVYSPPNSRFQTVDGAFFGTTFGCLFFMTFPDLDVGGSKSPTAQTGLGDAASPMAAHKDSRSSLSSSLASQHVQLPTPQAMASSSSSRATVPPQQPESINGVTPKNLAPGLGPGSIYEPRIYGFRVSEVAKTGPRMKWLRSRPVDVNELDECRAWAESQQATDGSAPAFAQIDGAEAQVADLGDSEMADENVEEDEGEVEDEDMGVNGDTGEPPDGVAQNGQPAHLPDITSSRKTSRRRNHGGVTNGEGGGGTALSVGGAG